MSNTDQVHSNHTNSTCSIKPRTSTNIYPGASSTRVQHAHEWGASDHERKGARKNEAYRSEDESEEVMGLVENDMAHHYLRLYFGNERRKYNHARDQTWSTGGHLDGYEDVEIAENVEIDEDVEINGSKAEALGLTTRVNPPMAHVSSSGVGRGVRRRTGVPRCSHGADLENGVCKHMGVDFGIGIAGGKGMGVDGGVDKGGSSDEDDDVYGRVLRKITGEIRRRHAYGDEEICRVVDKVVGDHGSRGEGDVNGEYLGVLCERLKRVLLG